MEQVTFYANAAALGIVIVLWFAFAGTFFLRKRPESAPDAKRSEKSWVGLILQGVGFALVWSMQRRPVFSPIIDTQPAISLIFDIIAIVFAFSSVWLAMAAIKELGKQWSLAARLVEGHKLVTTGVYQVVRHPIYTAMFGMLIATGIALSHWVGLVGGIIVFCIGTKIRTIFEERLLNDAFGSEFTEWRAKVPSLIPFVKI